MFMISMSQACLNHVARVAGCLERKAVSRADGKVAFRDVKNRYWGDLLPPAGFYDEFY
jgi:ribosomal protein RSM22 (predicted rRNA methylase)